MPGLLGSLCRIENWCEVSEVEALLREREVRDDHLSTRRDHGPGDLLFIFLFIEILGVDFPIQRKEDARSSFGFVTTVRHSALLICWVF